jgi:hypothetical protein
MVEPGYNDIGSCETFSIFIVRNSVVAINAPLLTITLYSSVRTTLVHNDEKCSVPVMTLQTRSTAYIKKIGLIKGGECNWEKNLHTMTGFGNTSDYVILPGS